MTTTTQAPAQAEYREIPLADLHTGSNVRDANRGIDALADSIAEVGILEPLIVTADGDGWIVLDGHRRLAGAHRAELATAPCVIRAAVDTDHERITLQLVANLQRDDLTTREEAIAFEQLTMAGLTAEQISKSTGRKAEDVADVVRLFVLPEPVRERTWQGQIELGDAIKLASITDPERREWLEKFIGTTSFGYKSGEYAWKDEQQRRADKAAKREQARRERDDHKAAVEAAKAAGEPIPPKPTKPQPQLSAGERDRKAREDRHKVLTPAAKMAAERRVPWVKARLLELAGQTALLTLAGPVMTMLREAAARSDWQLRSTLKTLGVKPTDSRPGVLLVAMLASDLRLLAEWDNSYAWERKEDQGPTLVRWLVEHLGYEPSPEELELASGNYGKPGARKAVAKKAPAAKRAPAKKAPAVKKAAPAARSRATVVSPARKRTPAKKAPAVKKAAAS